MRKLSQLYEELDLLLERQVSLPLDEWNKMEHKIECVLDQINRHPITKTEKTIRELETSIEMLRERKTNQ